MGLKRILVLDGGGAKGVIQSSLMMQIEARIGKPICEAFDLIVGTSVGSILGAIYAHGGVSAPRAHALMCATLPKVFKRVYFRKGLYSKDALRIAFAGTFGADCKMRNCSTKYMGTAVNICDGRTHFFKSWEPKDGEMPLYEVVDRSSAAPVYFPPIIDEANRAVWVDGGTGIDSAPITEAYVEAYRQGWLDNEHDRVHFLHIGTGYNDAWKCFDRAKNDGKLTTFGFYADPLDGGLARRQTTQSRVDMMRTIDACENRITYNRVDCVISKDIDKMDNIGAIGAYERIGISLSALVDYAALMA